MMMIFRLPNELRKDFFDFSSRFQVGYLGLALSALLASLFLFLFWFSFYFQRFLKLSSHKTPLLVKVLHRVDFNPDRIHIDFQSSATSQEKWRIPWSNSESLPTPFD